MEVSVQHESEVNNIPDEADGDALESDSDAVDLSDVSVYSTTQTTHANSPESTPNIVQHTIESPPLNNPIYYQSKLTLVTSLILIMSFALKHNLTDAALQDLLQLISHFVPTPNICIHSLHQFKKFFSSSQLNSK